MFMGFSRVAQGLIPSSLSRYSSAGISAASTVSKRSSAQTASGSHGESEGWVNHPELNFLGLGAAATAGSGPNVGTPPVGRGGELGLTLTAAQTDRTTL